MSLPATVPTGETFDYAPLAGWIRQRGTYPTNPRRALRLDAVHPNLFLRSTIEEWVGAKTAARVRALRQLH